MKCLFFIALPLLRGALTLEASEAHGQFVAGFVQGFIAGDDELKECVQAPVSLARDAQAAISHILNGDFVHAAENLDALADAIANAVRTCKESQGDFRDVDVVLKHIGSLKGLVTRLGHEVYESGPDIGSKALQSSAECKANRFEECGLRAGEAIRLLVIGEIPAIAPPPYNLGMQERSFAELSRALPSDEIEVFWNLSPLCMEQFRKWMGAAGLFHNSVGFKNLRTGLNMTIEFTAKNFDAQLILPALNYTDKTMSWNNSAELHAKEGVLDTTYWPNRTHIATVDGDTFNKLLSWGEAANQTERFQKYFLFNLASSTGRKQLDAFTCAEAAGAVVDQILNLAGPCVFNKSAPGLFQTEVLLVAGDNATLQSNSEASAVFDYYDTMLSIPELWSLNFGKTFEEVVRIAEQKLDGHMVYQDRSGQYWNYEPSRPVLSFRAAYQPLPGVCKESPAIADVLV